MEKIFGYKDLDQQLIEQEIIDKGRIRFCLKNKQVVMVEKLFSMWNEGSKEAAPSFFNRIILFITKIILIIKITLCYSNIYELFSFTLSSQDRYELYVKRGEKESIITIVSRL